jgi:hypothetical protein
MANADARRGEAMQCDVMGCGCGWYFSNMCGLPFGAGRRSVLMTWLLLWLMMCMYTCIGTMYLYACTLVVLV